MREALIIAITRMGDLIQTEPFCRALKRTGRVSRVVLLVEEAFTPVASKLVGIDEIVSLRFRDVLPHLGQNVRNYPVTVLGDLIRTLRERNFSEVWNLTHTRPAMMLVAAIGGASARGVSLDSKGLQVVRANWLKYFFACNLARPWSPFNLIDVYVNASDPATPFKERLPQLRSGNMQDRRLNSYRDLHVLLHPGASQRDKQWPVERFHSLASSLLTQGATVTLIGGKGDRVLADGFSRHDNLENRLGQTTFDELLKLIANSSLLISADSGPVHIAAALGVKVIAIEGGSAHGWETSPYGVGHWILQPHLPNLLQKVPGKKSASGPADSISARSVLSTVETILGEKQTPLADPGCTVYESAASIDGRNLELSPRAGAVGELEKWHMELRGFWNGMMSEHDSRECGRPKGGGIASIAGECAAISNQIAETPTSSESALFHLASKLKRAQQELIGNLSLHPPLHPAMRYLDIALASAEGESIQEQARATARVFEQMSRGLNCLDPATIQTNLITNYNNVMEESCASI